jgi:PKD repeat protein/predicted RNA-binding protein with TRAM domain
MLRSFSSTFVAITVSFALGTALAQPAPPDAGLGMFGSAHPFNMRDLPPGRTRDKIDNLPAPARERALNWLHRFDFPANDLDSLEIDDDGGVLYADQPPPTLGADEQTASDTEDPFLELTTAAVDDAFNLHSRPGAINQVYLDFNGLIITGTAWNSSTDPLYARPFDLDGDSRNFNSTERAAIAEIWYRVSEDFAPFDIDVTTEEPTSFGTNTGRILITSKTDANGAAMPYNWAGGVAYVGVWGRSDDKYSPALIYFDNLSKGTTYIAEASSHEFGHNLGLSHDGTSSAEYYEGLGSGYTSWAPIMGNSYYKNVTQWSKGDYAGANNTQDDLGIIGSKLGWVVDDHGGSSANATPLSVEDNGEVLVSDPELDPFNLYPANKGTIDGAGDADYFSFDAPGGMVELTVNPAWQAFYRTSRRGANLDVSAQLLDADGNVLVASDPTSDTFATVTTTLTEGSYFLAVSPVGNGNYSNYASQGQYFISGTLAAAPNTPPQADFGFDCDGLICGFTNTSTDANGSISAIVWDFGDGDTATEQNPTHSYSAEGSYSVTLTATDNDGASASVTNEVAVTASGTVLSENFADGNFAGWSIVDEGTSNGPSQWSVQGGALVQASNIITPGSAPSYFGTYALYENGYGWSDYRVRLTLESTDDDLIGVMFRVVDSDHYYRLWWHAASGYGLTLDKRIGGTTTVLAQNPSFTYQPGRTYQVEIEAVGDQLAVYVDGALLLTAQDASLSGGTIALYSAANDGSRYDNIVVEDLTDASDNLPPQITGLTVPSDILDTDVATFLVQATDPDGDDGALSYAWQIDPAEGAFSAVAAASTDYTPVELTGSRQYQVTVTVTDAGGGTVSESRMLTVTDADASSSPLLSEDFADGDYSGWSIVDEGTSSGPSQWSVQGGALVQASNIITPGSAPSYFGTYALYVNGYGWSDYRVRLTLESTDDDLIGVMFRVVDSDHYYRLWWHAASGYGLTLDKRIGGTTTVLAQNPSFTYQPGRTYQVEIEAVGDQLAVYVDGALLLTAQDASLSGGTIALYSAANDGSRYDNIVVEDLTDASDNLPPQITGLTVPSDILDTDVATFLVQATDPDGDDGALSYAWQIDPAEGAFSAVAAASTDYTPVELTGSRQYQVTVTVTDAGGGTVSGSRMLTVTDADASSSPLLSEDFADGGYSGWSIVDEGTSSGPSQWSVQGGALVQGSNIIIPGDGPAYRGTYAVYESGYTWSDYRVRLTLESTDDDLIGVMFRVLDSENYYRLWWHGTSGLGLGLVLDKRVGGTTTVLAQEAAFTYQPGQTYQVEIQAIGDQLAVYIDGVLMLTAQDASLSVGTIALYSAANEGSSYDNIAVEEAQP